MSKATRELGMQREQKRKLRRFLMWAGIILVLAGLVWLLIKAASLGPQSLSAGLAPEITAADWTYGNKLAKVTLIEYGDFQCPACGVYHPLVKRLVNAYKDRVLFVFRNFPLSQHAFALPAAYAAEAAGAQGKFWEMFDLIYSNQKFWADSADAKNKFEAYAAQLGLDLNKFRTDEDAAAVKNKVEKDLAGGQVAQVDHTPTFFINLKQIPNPQSYDEFKSAIDQALARNS